MKNHPSRLNTFMQVQAIAQTQGLVISEQQCLQVGFGQSRIHRLVREGLWKRLLPGIYQTSSGNVQWISRLHAALLYGGKGALISHESAAFVHGIVTKMPRVVSIVISEKRRVRPQPQVRIQRRRQLPVASGNPAVVIPSETLVDLLDSKINMNDALGYVTQAIRQRVRANDVLKALARRKRHRNRQLLQALLGAAIHGSESPLEYYFVRDVESAHRLPLSRKQASKHIGGRWIRSDCFYEAFQLRLELDGEIAHPGGKTNNDLWRDNSVAIEELQLTLRYRWFHVVVTPCETAKQIATALRQRGWLNTPQRCGETCQI